MQNIVCVCLTKSNKFPLTFSHSLTLPLRCTFINVQEKFFFIGDRINSFVPFIRSSCLHTLLDRSTCSIQGLHQPSRITHSSFSLSLSFCRFVSTYHRACVCVTQRQLLNTASLFITVVVPIQAFSSITSDPKRN